LGSTVVKRFACVMVESELPAAFEATKANVPTTVAGMSIKSVAELPSGAIVAFAKGIVEPGENVKVDPLKLAPLTVIDTPVVPASADFGLWEGVAGFGPT